MLITLINSINLHLDGSVVFPTLCRVLWSPVSHPTTRTGFHFLMQVNTHCLLSCSINGCRAITADVCPGI